MKGLAALCLVALCVVSAEDLATRSTGTVKFVGNGTEGESGQTEGRNREGKDFFDLFGLGTGPETDPYLAKANSLCLTGDLAECFKSRALGSLDDFFNKEGYYVNDNVRITRMPNPQLRRLVDEPYEFSSSPRADESEWDHFTKFLLRKVERFVKATAIEVRVPEEFTEEGRYSPRFVDEIADELDIIEDKKASVLTRYKLKKLFIPLLIVLKLFKLKLLLFLPMILGIASFKKLLGFLAIVLPGLIGFFKFCKPQFNANSNYYPQYSAAGVANSQFSHPSYSHQNFREDYLYTPYNSQGEHGKSLKEQPQKSGGVTFREEQKTDASDIAYGYREA